MRTRLKEQHRFDLLETVRHTKSSMAADKGNEKNSRLLRIRYQIKKGDSLASIAEKFDVEISMIKKWNNSKGSTKIQQGKTLTLFVGKGNSEREGNKENGKPGKSNLKRTKAETVSRIKLVLYTVKRGDSLAEIAQKFNTTPQPNPELESSFGQRGDQTGR